MKTRARTWLVNALALLCGAMVLGIISLGVAGAGIHMVHLRPLGFKKKEGNA